MELAKFDSDGLIDIRSCDPALGARLTSLRNAGFLDYVRGEQPQVENGFIAVDTHSVVNGKIVQFWEIKVDPQAILTQIANLKNQLSATDYQVVKCMELTMTGDPLPYDMNALHIERQAIRDEINRLEALL